MSVVFFMRKKCCNNCQHLAEIDGISLDKEWCLLTDEPVDYWEVCGSWRKE